MHIIHERGKGSNSMPIILTHGWPDSFYRFHKIIPMLTDPEKFGGKAKDSFDVVVPSMIRVEWNADGCEQPRYSGYLALS
jgi:hypothetical protein